VFRLDAEKGAAKHGSLFSTNKESEVAVNTVSRRVMRIFYRQSVELLHRWPRTKTAMIQITMLAGVSFQTRAYLLRKMVVNMTRARVPE
jgi:hypothetical protein